MFVFVFSFSLTRNETNRNMACVSSVGDAGMAKRDQKLKCILSSLRTLADSNFSLESLLPAKPSEDHSVTEVPTDKRNYFVIIASMLKHFH